jgi:uncharacterized protein YecE (DUF72 family)
LVCERFLREITPMIGARKLGALLLQLSPSFRPKSHELTELDSLRARLSPHPLAVELRNRDWVDGPRRSKTIDYFKSRKITFVLVDAPESEHFTVMPGMNCVTNPHLGYMRFHGRNESGYIRGRTVAERFDYDYTDEEVNQIAERVRALEEEIEELHLAANNNRSNYAPRLAERLQRALREKARLQEPRQKELFTLD